jgi:anti-sigma factor RsiW
MTHWSDEQIIARLYGVGPSENHLHDCDECRARVSEAGLARQASEPEADVPFELLAAQRRRIYSQLSKPLPWWAAVRIQKWASLGASLLVLGGGMFLYEQNRSHKTDSLVTDAQLALEVSQLSQDSEPASTAPLQALFE